MAALQETLAVLLGAEGEAKRVVSEAKGEAEGLIRSSQDKFAQERDHRMAGARQQAASLLENARTAAETEASQILDLGKAERDRMTQRFGENARMVVQALAAETAERILRREDA